MDILSTRNEHIIYSPLHPQVSILVPHSDIPCEIPTLANCLLIGIWSMPIPLEGFWWREADNHLTRYACANYLIRKDVARRISCYDTYLLVKAWSTSTSRFPIQPRADREGIHLRTAKVVHKDFRTKPLKASLRERRGHCGSSVSYPGKRSQIVLIELRTAHEIII